MANDRIQLWQRKLLSILQLVGILTLSVPFLYPASAQVNTPGASEEDIIDASYSGPVLLDTFWTDSKSVASSSTVEREVGPGDGEAILAVVLANRGFSDITAVTGHLTLPAGFTATGSVNDRIATASFNNIVKASGTFTLFFDVDVTNEARVGTHAATLQTEFTRVLEVGTARQALVTVPFRLEGKAILELSRFSGDTSEITPVVAGKVEDFAFVVANKGTTPVTSVVITIASPSESLKILGDSKWTIQRVDPGSQVSLATTVYAASALIGNPASFDVTAEYSSNGQSKSDTFTLGTYIDGEISIRAYDLAVTYIGGTPNIVGNLLNEGNTVALFTTIELTGAPNLVATLPAQQYLGDLSENSPLPFSIPIDVNDGVTEGTYSVSIKVTYKDSLKELHMLDISSQVNFALQQQAAPTGQNLVINGNMPIVVGGGIAIAVAVAVAIAVRRRRRTALKRAIQSGKEQGEDIESVLDSQLAGSSKRPDDRI